MGSSDLQAWIIGTIIRLLHQKLNYKKYKLLSNKVGYKFAPRSWYNLDTAVISRKKIKTGNYKTSPPELVVEVDTKADTKKFHNPQDYIHMKTQDLPNSDVKKIVWIFTPNQKI